MRALPLPGERPGARGAFGAGACLLQPITEQAVAMESVYFRTVRESIASATNTPIGYVVSPYSKVPAESGKPPVICFPCAVNAIRRPPFVPTRTSGSGVASDIDEERFSAETVFRKAACDLRREAGKNDARTVDREHAVIAEEYGVRIPVAVHVTDRRRDVRHRNKGAFPPRAYCRRPATTVAESFARMIAP